MLSALLDKSADLERSTDTTDAAGGVSQSWAAIYVGVACALWPKVSWSNRSFQRPDILGTHVICTDRDLGAKASDRFLLGGVYYIVQGVEPFADSGVSAETVYVHNVTLRTV